MSAIKEMRTKMKLSQEQMGKWLGMSRIMIAQCETNRKNPTTAALLRIAALEIILNVIKKSEKKSQISGKDENHFGDPLATLTNKPKPELTRHVFKIKTLQQQLSSIKKDHDTLQLFLNGAAQLLNKYEKEKNEKEKKQFTILHGYLQKQYLKVDQRAQLPLAAKILGKMKEYEVLNAEF